MKKNRNKHLLAAAVASLCATAWAGNPPSDSMDPSPQSNTPNGRVPAPAQANDDQAQLELKLKSVQNRADYAKAIESSGYRISAINEDKSDYLEYEIVKANYSYEVQLDFDHGASKATSIDVTNNIWRADSTEKMLKDPQYRASATMVADPESRFSDRHRMQAWTDEKDQLEKALMPKQTLDAYKATLKKEGYEITSVNDRKADYVEYEIVKGDNSYEVQIDLDPKTKLATDVDVTSNLWDAEDTDKAKEYSEARHAG